MPPRTKRTEAEAQNIGSLYATGALEKHYKDQTSKESMSWITQVTKGVETKFSLMKVEGVNSDQLESVYDLAMRIKELDRTVTQAGLRQIFTIFKVLAESPSMSLYTTDFSDGEEEEEGDEADDDATSPKVPPKVTAPEELLEAEMLCLRKRSS
jgi:hypothetical protein